MLQCLRSVWKNQTQIEKKGVVVVKFNHSKLLGRMREYGFTQQTLAKAIGINESTLNAKLNSKGYFSTLEIDKIRALLNIADEEIGAYFYAH